MARSKELVRGVGRLSRSQVKERRGLFKGRKTLSKAAAEEVPPHTEKQIGGEKNGGTRLVPTQKASRYYPAEDVRQPKKSRKVAKITKLRPSITPGTVLILLAGKYRGKRVVFLKQLESGLLLITGPFKVNGVPLRRVNQAYVISTSTKLDLSEFKVRLVYLSSEAPLTLFYRLTRNSATLTLLRRRAPARSPLRRSSSKTTSLSRKASPKERLQIRRKSIKLLSLRSKRRRTCRST